MVRPGKQDLLREKSRNEENEDGNEDETEDKEARRQELQLMVMTIFSFLNHFFTVVTNDGEIHILELEYIPCWYDTKKDTNLRPAKGDQIKLWTSENVGGDPDVTGAFHKFGERGHVRLKLDHGMLQAKPTQKKPTAQTSMHACRC